MPSSFVQSSGRPRKEKSEGTGNEIGWTGEGEGDVATEAESLDDGGKLLVVSSTSNPGRQGKQVGTYNVLEPVRRKMKMGHECEDLHLCISTED